MPRILYFNPENDLALAANDPHYTPPASALQMATDLQRLPLRWAEPGDWILLRDGTVTSPLTPHLLSLISNLSSLISPPSFLPWGWSPLTVTDFLRAGVPASLLPTHDQMQAFRTLAGRATAADVLRRLRERLTEAGYGDMIVGEAHVCHTLDEAREWHKRFGESIFKQPWSGSGRGLLPAHDGVLTAKNEEWIRRTLRLQGYVMAEPRYDKRLDFALEFWRHADGHVTYEGLSLFMTTPGGVYAGNIVDTEEGKLRRLSPLLTSPKGEESGSKVQGFKSSSSIPHPSSLTPHPPILGEVRRALIDELSALPPTFYEGPIGVDMMICQASPSSIFPLPSSLFRLHPCVEINFRMTMGWLALHIDPDV